MKRALLSLPLLAALTLQAQVKLPPFTRQVLPNGVVIYLMPKHDVPLLALQATIRGGSQSDPVGKAGLSAVTAELLPRGTSSRSADEFADQLESLGANLRTYASEDATVVSCEVLARAGSKALDLLTDAILHPSFAEPEVKKLLAQRIDASKSMKDNPGVSASLYFRSFLFGPTHPYGHPPMGDEVSLAAISRSDIAGYHRQTYLGRNLTIAAVGDFDPAAFGPALSRAFGSMPEGKAYQWAKDVPPSRPAQAKVLLVDKPDATQTYFLIGGPGIPRTHPDWPKIWLVNTLFGGRFTSMLNDELRVNTGLTYGARSFVDRHLLTGAMAISTYTRTDSTERAVDLALSLLKRLNETGITAGQLASAKAYLKGTFPPANLESADQLAARLSELELHGQNRGEIDDLFSRLDAVTLQQANEAARKYYPANGLTFLLLGNAAKVRQTARKYGPALVEVPVTQPGFGFPMATGARTP